jgi:hypothetical protein
MLRRVGRWTLLLTVMVASAGCASTNQWAEWRSRSSHFASGDHLWFSMRNQGAVPRVRRRHIEEAGRQGWWGDPVLVRPDQVSDR